MWTVKPIADRRLAKGKAGVCMQMNCDREGAWEAWAWLQASQVWRGREEGCTLVLHHPCVSCVEGAIAAASAVLFCYCLGGGGAWCWHVVRQLQHAVLNMLRPGRWWCGFLAAELEHSACTCCHC